MGSAYVVGTFDTKGAELRYAAGGAAVTSVDLSTSGEPADVDVPAAEVAAAHPDFSAAWAALAEAAAEVDVVLDYVWGPPTELAMRAVLGARTQHTRLLDWVQIGGMGGDAITLSGHALRSNAFRILGSGFGSVAMQVMHREFTELIAAIAAGGMAVRPHPFPLDQVEAAWTHKEAPGERTVIIL